MADRADIIRKIRSLRSLGTSSNEHEAKAANEMADTLVERYKVTDEELFVAEEAEVVLFGHKLFFFSRVIEPHFLAIKAEVAAMVAKLHKETTHERAAHLTRMTKKLKDQGVALEKERNLAVKALYAEAIAEEIKMRKEFGYIDEGDLTQEPHIHKRGLFAVNLATDLRNDHIERIVGVSEAKLWEKLYRNNVCVACGLDGKEGREVPGYFGKLGDRHWMHPSCAEKQGETKRARDDA